MFRLNNSNSQYFLMLMHLLQVKLEQTKSFLRVQVSANLVTSGTLDINKNGDFDVIKYKNVKVAVPASETDTLGTKNISSNGVIDVTGYSKVNVNIPNNPVEFAFAFMMRGTTGQAYGTSHITANSTELGGIWLKATTTGKYWDSVTGQTRMIYADSKICEVGVPGYGSFTICCACYIGN